MGVEAEAFLYTDGLVEERLDSILLLLGEFCEMRAIGGYYTPDVESRFRGLGFTVYSSLWDVLEALRKSGANVSNGKITENRTPIYEIRFLEQEV